MRIPSLRSVVPPEVKMTPMIDVVFLLLVFFLWTSSFELPEFDLPGAIAEPPVGGSRLRSDVTPPIEPFEEIVIRLLAQDANVVIEFNGQQVDDVRAMKDRLAEIIALGIQPPVIVDPADQITMNTAVEVYDAARAAGADRVLFAVRP